MVSVTHTFVSGIADDPKAAAAGEVLPSHWNAAHTISGVRTTLTADANYYVSATGSDSNGGTNPTTDAWATIQHAFDFISEKLDGGSIFNVFINVGAGSFVGAGVKPCVGVVNLLLVGAGSGSTTIADGPNDGVFNTGECLSIFDPIDFAFFFQGVTLLITSLITGADNYNQGFGNCLAFDLSPNPADVVVSHVAGAGAVPGFGFRVTGGVLTLTNVTAHGLNQQAYGLFAANSGGRISQAGVITFAGGNPTYNVSFVEISDLSVIELIGTTYVNGFTGPVIGLEKGGGFLVNTGAAIPGTSGRALTRAFMAVNDILFDIGRNVVSAQFDKTSSAALADIPGLSANVVKFLTYEFEAVLFTTSNVAGGVQAAVGGTCSATSIIYEGETIDGAALKVQTRATALATSVGGVNAVTAARIDIKGSIVVNAGGTLTIQFAQNTSNLNTSSVLVGSYMIVRGVP